MQQKCNKKQPVVRVGLGELHSQRSATALYFARKAFLDQVFLHVPPVFGDLRNLLSVPTGELNKGIDAWARQHHFLKNSRTPHWVRAAARSTVLKCSLNPSATGFDLGSAADFSLLPADELIVHTAYDPSADTHADAHARFQQRLDAIDAKVKGSGQKVERTHIKRDMNHFRWAARFQCGGESIKTPWTRRSPAFRIQRHR